MNANWALLVVPVIAIVCFWAYMINRSLVRSRLRELEIRERIAMIERGLVPAPEADPRGFDSAMRRHDTIMIDRASMRHRRMGVILMGVGFGLMFMIGFAGEEPRQAIGVGGFIVMIGLAFLVNGFLGTRHERLDPPVRDAGGPASSSSPTS